MQLGVMAERENMIRMPWKCQLERRQLDIRTRWLRADYLGDNKVEVNR